MMQVFLAHELFRAPQNCTRFAGTAV